MTQNSPTHRVADVMTRDLATLRDGDTMDLADGLMSAARVRHLPVVDEDYRLMGLVTHRDLLRATVQMCGGMDARERAAFLRRVPIDTIMQRDVRTVTDEMTIVDAAHIILEGKFGCLPVVDADGRLVGLVTEHDFVLLVVRLLSRGPEHAGPTSTLGS